MSVAPGVAGRRAGTEFIRPLTGVRFVAAMWVALYHYRFYLDNVGALPAPLNDLLSFGAAGVQLFWVLSGFVIAHPYLEGLGPRPSVSGSLRFFWLRLARVWPVHVATMLLAGAVILYNHHRSVYYVMPPTSQTPSAVVRNLLLMNDWPFWVPGTSWNLVSWTVSLEWLAYLAFPVVALVAYRLRDRLPVSVLAALAVVPIVWFVAYCATQRPTVHPPWVFTSELAVDFLTGVVLYLLFRRVRHWPGLERDGVRWTLAFVPPALVVGACLTIPHLVTSADVGLQQEVPYWLRSFVTPLFVLWVLALALQTPGQHKFLASRPLVLGGFVSYSLYMVQFGWLAVWAIVTGRFPPQDQPGGVLWTAGLVGGLLVAAFLLWRFVEEPARELLRRLVGVQAKPAGEPEAEFWRPRLANGNGPSEAAPAPPNPVAPTPAPTAKVCRLCGEQGSFDKGRRVCRRCRQRLYRERRARHVAANGAGDEETPPRTGRRASRQAGVARDRGQ